MHLICETPLLENYLSEHEIVDYSHPLIQETISRLQSTEDFGDRACTKNV